MEELPKKQYLLMTDDLTSALLRKLVPGISFIEVQGMAMTDNANFQVLVTPLHIETPAIPKENETA